MTAADTSVQVFERVGPPVERHCLAQHGVVASETVPPQRFADHGRRSVFRPTLVRAEGPSHQCLGAQHAKEVRSDVRNPKSLGSLHPGEIG